MQAAIRTIITLRAVADILVNNEHLWRELRRHLSRGLRRHLSRGLRRHF